jgi:hypothetical protein
LILEAIEDASLGSLPAIAAWASGSVRALGDYWAGLGLLASSGLPAWWAQVLARPGRPVSPGRLDDGRVKGRRRRSRRDAKRP